MYYKDILAHSRTRKAVIVKIVAKDFSKDFSKNIPVNLENLSEGKNLLIDVSTGEFVNENKLPSLFDKLIVLDSDGQDLLKGESGQVIFQDSGEDVSLKEALLAAASKAYEDKKYYLVEFLLKDNNKLKFFFEPILNPERLIIFGGGHISLPLVKMAKILGYYIVVVDDRLEFANFERFPEADEVICEEFDAVFEKGYVRLGKNDNVVLLTRGHEFDELCLRQVVESSEAPGYTGLIGSRRRVGKIINELKEDFEHSEKQLNRLENIFTPIGLDIGAQTPEEIAISILAELVAVSKGRLDRPENRPKIGGGRS